MHTNAAPVAGSRRRRLVVCGVGVGVTTLMVGVGAHMALADTTLFSDDFESGSTSNWSKSGGSWAVVTDGSQALQQSNASSENAREFAGDTGWTDYSLQARVKPISLSSGSTIGIDARVQSSTKFYRLALVSDGVQLQEVNGSSITVLGSSAQTVSTGTWYTLRLDVSSSSISAYVDGTSVASTSDSTYDSGRIGLQTLYATASFDDVTVSSDASSTPTATATSATATATATATASASASSATPTASATTTSSPVSDAVYVSPSGTDSAAGTISAPTTLTSALTKVSAGGTIYLRGGTYSYSTTITIEPGNDGTSNALKTLSAYPGETPVLNFSAMAESSSNRGLAVNADYWHVYGVVVEYAGDNGIFVGGSNNIIESTITRYNHDSGLQISRISSDTADSDWPANNLVVSAESHDNADSDGEDADGFAAKLTIGTGNVFRYCVSHNNIDDGWDLYTKSDTGAIGPVTIDHSLAYDNGTLTDGTVNTNGDRNGYKLGGSDISVDHIVTNSIAYQNGKHGFTWNSNPGTMTISGNVSIDNEERNFAFDEGTSVFRDNTSCRSTSSGTNDKISGDSDSSNQFWTGSNGSRCSSYLGSMSWSFASDGSLVVTFA